MTKPKTYKYLLLAAITILFMADFASATEPQRQNKKKNDTAELAYGSTDDDDAIYLGDIEPAWSFANGKFRNNAEWRKYCRLVYNFNKVYPYALVGKSLESKADSTITAQRMSRRKKEKYVNEIQRELIEAFEKPLRRLTISQGALLIRLVDREIGSSGYDIIKDYKSGLAAGFWQGIAKMFKNDLKTHYDPNGIDRQTEELVQMWHSGEFPDFYFSIFFEYPEVTSLPEKYK